MTGETVVSNVTRIDRLAHDNRQLTLQVEDLRAQLYQALDMSTDANRNAANLSREYGMAIREIHSLEAELEEAKHRITELEEGEQQ